LSQEWGALQPQRFRIVKPAIFVIPNESTSVDFDARVFADGFGRPVTMKARLDINVTTIEMTVEQLVPDIQQAARETKAKSGCVYAVKLSMSR